MTKQEIIKRFESIGFELRLDNDITFGFKKGTTTIMCSLLGSSTTISISFNKSADKDKAVRFMAQMFPTAEYIEQNYILSASYFSLPTTH